MLLLLGAFIAGILTVLAPCVLPLLPVIIGGSVGGDVNDKRRPLLIAGSLAVSLLLFTLLLKATTVLVGIPPQTLSIASGVIIISLGLVTLFPQVYTSLMLKLGIEHRAQELLQGSAAVKSSVVGPILTGAALGPVFSSCSPVYVYILAAVLPVSFGSAMAYLLSYVLGLSLIMLLISYYGQKVVRRVKFAAKPNGWFQRSLAVIFILVGLGVATGYDKKFQTYVSSHTPFNFDALSAKLIPLDEQEKVDGVLNVTPYKAPELTGLEGWINSQPTTLASLKGKVVLVDFWTYSCINCIRNNPYIERWYQTYKEDGFTVIGLHAPEFAFEKVASNVEKAVRDQKITYPVALDNNFATWNAFKNRYWPAGYLIDAEGNVRRVHYGEGQYVETEAAIRQLLVENGKNLSGGSVTTGKEQDFGAAGQTPETYLGKVRAASYVGTPALGSTTPATFSPAELGQGEWTLTGDWEVQGEKIISRGASTVSIKVRAKEVYLVAGSAQAGDVTVLINGQSAGARGGSDVKDGVMTVGENRLYRVTSYGSLDPYVLTLEVPAGVELNAFTFGG
ncbi:cytochrome c biogenesis protein DipZ [soil metagenome]